MPTTNFPEPIGLAATFDAPLIHTVASVISTEVQALHTLGRQTGHLGRIGTGLDTWSPNINIFRDPRWGRGQETYGEDPYLTARMGVAFIQGMQGDNPDLPDVVATPKHFAVHSGPEPSRHTDNIFATKRDLSGLGNFCAVGMIGIILASVVNIFMGSPALHFAISVIGVLIFAGLTAYDTQKMREYALSQDTDNETGRRASIMAALELYLDFIMMFIYLAQILGISRD